MTGGGAGKDPMGDDDHSGGLDASVEEGAAGHIPVLLAEVLARLKPTDGETYLDGTFGAGGYSKAILEAAQCTVIALDRDPDAVAAAEKLVKKFAPRLSLHEARFSQMADVVEAQQKPGDALASGQLDGIVFDLGVSSMQLDQRTRGFSFQSDGPLDMRMGGDGPSVADVLASTDESEIADILYYLGDERRSRAIARAIVNERKEAPLERTVQLAELVARVLGRKGPNPKHPATRTFQALRIYVNDELGELSEALRSAEHLLKPSGRLVVVTFHSLEDRIVKRFLVSRTGSTAAGSRHMPRLEGDEKAPSFQFVNRRPVSPGQAETDANARARSAKLRAAIRTEAPAWEDKDPGLSIPRMAR